ncbi:MAG: PIN domain-containing protein [Pseudomonadota bacterium]
MPDFEVDYGALTLDTSVFDNHGIAIEKGLFRQLHQFKDSPVRFILSDIVYREVRKHLLEKTKDARGKVAAAVRAASAQQLANEHDIAKASEMISPTRSADVDIVDKRLTDFFEATDAKLVESSEHVSIAQLLGMYFESQAPFEGAGDKKSEFPDALALLALEAWAEHNSLNVLAVSTDKGWKSFAKNHLRIHVVDSLSDAISLFQPHHAAKDVVAELQTAISSGNESPILDEIARAVANSIDSAEIHADASSVYYFEEDVLYAAYLSHRFVVDDKGTPEVSLIRVDSEGVVVQVSALVKCDVHGTFSLSTWDSIDKEYIGIGSTSSTQTETYQTDILVTLTGKFPAPLASLEIEEIEVLDTVSHVDFGDLEPDWREYEE